MIGGDIGMFGGTTRTLPSNIKNGDIEMREKKGRSKRATKRRDKQQLEGSGLAQPPRSGGEDGGRESAATIQPPAHHHGADDERESLVNGRECGPANRIATKVEEVASIHGFMSDLDCKILDPAVVGEECVRSPAALYEQHVRHWLDRDLVLAKAQVRDSGYGLHVILMLDEPIICGGDDARHWDKIARGFRNAVPGDPNLNGIIAMTRPVGALNTKSDPPKEVRLLRAGEPTTRAEVLDLNRRVTEQPARLWMRLFFGGERAGLCPFCSKELMGVAGNWQVQCYECGRMDAAALVYRFYSPDFLEKRKDSHG